MNIFERCSFHTEKVHADAWWQSSVDCMEYAPEAKGPRQATAANRTDSDHARPFAFQDTVCQVD